LGLFLSLHPLKHVAPTELEIRIDGGVYKYSAPPELARLLWPWPRYVIAGICGLSAPLNSQMLTWCGSYFDVTQTVSLRAQASSLHYKEHAIQKD